jgi:hypothetical protein
MENRDKDQWGEDTEPSSPSSDVDKSESESSFDENIGRSEEWKDEPKDEPSGWKGDGGRSSNLGEQEDVSSSRSGRGEMEH